MQENSINDYIQIGLLIITFVSLLSPVLVAIINNQHNYKIKKLELSSVAKQEVLKQFALSVNLEFITKSYKAKFRQDLNLLYVYFDVNDKLVNKLLSTDYKNVKDFQDDVIKLMKDLSKQI